MRIIWCSNAPWVRTGYGNQTRLFVPRIQDLGHEVTISAVWGLNGGVVNIDKRTKVLPQLFATGNVDVIASQAESEKADVVITLFDSWCYPNDVTSKFRWAPWLPIDADPVPPAVVDALRTAWQPIAYSRFGEAQLRAAGFDPMYVPHGVDTKVFAPKPRDEARRELKWEDKEFVAVMVAANKGFPPRKAFPEALVAFRRFIDRHPKSMLYIHAGQTCGSVPVLDFDAILRQLQFPDGAIMFCDSTQLMTIGYPDSFMCNVYNAADVLLNPSRGEGFGIPIVEAQACGTPVIVGDWTSMPELCFAGWRVQGQQCWNDQDTWQYTPSIDGIEAALESAWESRGSEELRERARAGALPYDADTVTREYWKPALERLQERIEGKVAPAPAHRWAGTGLWVDGTLRFPCLDGDCPAELCVDPKTGVRTVHPTGFELQVGDVDLSKLVDDLSGGVVKVVVRELRRSYELDGIPFEDGDVVLDIGAHVGVISTYLGLKCPKLRIIAFEPVPANYERLVANLKAHGVTNVEAVNLAVSGDAHVVVLRGDPGTNTGGMGIAGTGATEVVAEPITLAQIWADFGLDRVRLLKIDCEGSEYGILSGADGLLDKVDYLRGELHPVPGQDMDALLDHCARHLPKGHIRMTKLGQGEARL